MILIPHVTYFLGCLPIPIAIAATLWLDMRRDQRRRRLAQSIQSVLQDVDCRPERREDWKKAA